MTLNEPRHEISNNMVCATSKASDQPAHTRSLIRAFAIRLNNLKYLSLKRRCIGFSEFTLVKIPHCWKSHVSAQVHLTNESVSSNNGECFCFCKRCSAAVVINFHEFSLHETHNFVLSLDFEKQPLNKSNCSMDRFYKHPSYFLI